jgi:hypothetical protein
MRDEPIIRLTPVETALCIVVGAVVVACWVVGLLDAVRGGLM